MGIDQYLMTRWVPCTVLLGSDNRKFLCTNDGAMCIVTTRIHPLLTNERQVEISLLDEGEMAIREAGA